VNFTRDVLEAAAGADTALIEVARDGKRREWTFGEVAARSASMAGALAERGVERGDVVMTLIGNRPEWVLTMLACFRLGAVVLPCTEQLRAKDLRLRLKVAKPKAVVADERNAAVLGEALGGGAPGGAPGGVLHVEVVTVPDDSLLNGPPAAAVEIGPEDPCLITFTSGTTGEPRAVVHGGRYLSGQHVQAENWLGAKRGEVVWCTASSGWSKSARNVFIAPWLSGATALLHDGRFDPEERLQIAERERINVLCMAPTEYRVIAKRTKLRRLPDLRGMVAAGEALNPEVLRAWEETTGLGIRDGYGQTETGQLTGMPIGERPKPGSMGKALQGMRLTIEEGELVVDAASVPTFFLGYLGEAPPKGQWHTGDLVREDDEGYLYFEGRNDDVIVSSGYRIGPFEVESALVAHPAVAEAAAVAAPDEERGAVVRAVVVLRDGHAPTDALKRELQEHVKRETAPNKYPRIVEFAAELPKTASGKVKRAELRG
jgi:acyl-coenzyme A synthetase/AMP-(fatty) acid ligase